MIFLSYRKTLIVGKCFECQLVFHRILIIHRWLIAFIAPVVIIIFSRNRYTGLYSKGAVFIFSIMANVQCHLFSYLLAPHQKLVEYIFRQHHLSLIEAKTASTVKKQQTKVHLEHHYFDLVQYEPDQMSSCGCCVYVLFHSLIFSFVYSDEEETIL